MLSFNGKRLSILGDSLSTYKGISNDASANTSIGYNHYFYCEPFPLSGTYFMRVLKEFNMVLCVNNSFSGGNLSGQNDPTSGLNRAHQLADNCGNKPDLIIVFIGINDLGRRVDPDIFATDYFKTLKIIKENYPNALVCCVNLPDRDIYLKDMAVIFNNAISDAVNSMGDNFFTVDLFNSRLNNDFYYNNTVDGLHLDEDGAKIVAQIIIDKLKDINL